MAFPSVRSSAIPAMIKPAIAMPFFEVFNPRMPRITPAMAIGKPQMGKSQAHKLRMPSTNAAIARPGLSGLTG